MIMDLNKKLFSFHFFLIFCLFNLNKLSSQSCAGSLLFDSTNPAVFLPFSNQYYSGANGGYTWECWFKLNSPFTTDVRPLISSVDAVVFEDMYLGFGWSGGWFDEPSTKIVFKVDGPSSTFPTGPNCSYSPPGGFIIGTWYHVAGVMNYSTQIASLYLNGLIVDTKSITTPPITRTIDTELSYNWGGTPYPLFGNMDEVRIWERPLSSAEILMNYDKCLSGSEPNLLLYYKCNKPWGSNVKDITSNHNDGTFALSPNWAIDEPILTGTVCLNNSSSTIGIISSNSVICTGNTTTISASGATSYTWSTGVNTSSIVVTPSVSTSYSVSGIVSGCLGDYTDTVISNIIVTTMISSDFVMNFDTCNSNIQFLCKSFSDQNSWTFSDGYNKTNSCDFVISNTNNGNYSVTLITNPSTLCADTTSKMFNVNNLNSKLDGIPNVITPNNDGVNDKLYFSNFFKCEDYTFEVYNRWGQNIFKSTTNKNYWDGKNTNNELVNDGLYFYILYTNKKNYKGNVSVFR